jgi:hypothetical protein
MSGQSLTLLQHSNIVDRVLSHCVAPYDPNRYPDPSMLRRPIRVPKNAAWLIRAALTCKAFLEPALRHSYRTLYLHAVQAPAGVLDRVGPWVRTLIIYIEQNKESVQPNIPFDLFTNIATLVVVCVRPDRRHVSDLDAFISDMIISCPSLPNIVNLVLWHPRWHNVVE